MAERIVEIGSLAPEEANAKLPKRLRLAKKLGHVELEIFVQVQREGRRTAFADADDADIRRTDQRDGNLRQTVPQRDGRDKAGAAAAQDYDAVDSFLVVGGRVHPLSVAKTDSIFKPKPECHLVSDAPQFLTAGELLNSHDGHT